MKTRRYLACLMLAAGLLSGAVLAQEWEDLEEYLGKNPEELPRLGALVEVEEINRASVKVLGAESKEEVFQDLERYFRGGSLTAFQEEILTLARGEKAMEKEIRIRDVAGKPKTLRLSLKVFPGCEESWARVLVSFIDITELKEAEEALRESEAFFRQVVETAEGTFCWTKTPDGARRQALQLGDTNNVLAVVQAGVKEGDEVFLNPLAFEAPGTEILKSINKAGGAKTEVR